LLYIISDTLKILKNNFSRNLGRRNYIDTVTIKSENRTSLHYQIKLKLILI